MAEATVVVNPDASFDALYVLHELAQGGQSLSLVEIHVFLYLACILGLYDGRAVSKWGYSFVATPDASPFSMDLLTAVRSLTGSGLIEAADDFMTVTEDGQAELGRWERLSRFKQRIPYLRGSTGAAIALPLQSVTDGIQLEPQLHNAELFRHSRHLLDEAGVSQIYQHFQILERSFGQDVPDYMLPAVVWLSFLLEQDNERS
ncbi:hypothetical protein ABT299_16725 [Spirillospora sp. NPDC000708]